MASNFKGLVLKFLSIIDMSNYNILPMVPNANIFCNSPWYELQIYWDGSLGFCCHESHKIYPDDRAQKYNIKNMSIREWMDSEPMRQARLKMFTDEDISFCSRCYHEEKHSSTSRRHRSNQKSVIFTKTDFDTSYLQSPGLAKFQFSKDHEGEYHGVPIDIHIDLGNYCNLSCKMCEPRASSAIAAQYVKWGITDAKKYLGTDWTRDEITWNRVLEELSGIDKLKNVHFMGGETLITPRFEDFVDHMLSAGRTDLNFSFVTNGTVFRPKLMEKLMRFQRVGIEVSIETITPHNAYQRQGTDNDVVLRHIKYYQQLCDNNKITLTMRPAISVLTIGYYHTLLEFCWRQRFLVKSLLCTQPRYLDARILPRSAKNLYRSRYLDLADRLQLDFDRLGMDFNESDPNMIDNVIAGQIQQVLALLDSDPPSDLDQQWQQMASWCRRWDAVHGLDARLLYPEFRDLLDQHGY